MRTTKTILIVLFIICINGAYFAQTATHLREGMKAPNFNLQNHQGKFFKLSSFKGKSPVVIYFYPKAGTPGCTKQACGIRDDLTKFKENNIVVLGISSDSKKELRKFVRENKLNFPLLSDNSKTVLAKYGVLRDDGKAKRVTFIIDRNGMIAKILEVSGVSTHSHEVFEIASQL
ncbi:MAG TPA: peroxiredoxin [Ignavibacteriales bacterium]|nr:peroxiredoxin [Ignavibacteriales bacterium]